MTGTCESSLRIDNYYSSRISGPQYAYDGAHISAEHLLGYGMGHPYEEVCYLIRGEMMASHERHYMGIKKYPGKQEVQIGYMRRHYKRRSPILHQFFEACPVILCSQFEFKEQSGYDADEEPVCAGLHRGGHLRRSRAGGLPTEPAFRQEIHLL